MRHPVRASALLGVVLVVSACASGGPRTASAPRRPDLITEEEMRARQRANLYDLISEVRGNWLHVRGSDTMLGPRGEVQVRFNDLRLGGVGTLRDIPLHGITYIQYFEPNAAAARWGLGFGNGVIYVSTRPR